MMVDRLDMKYSIGRLSTEDYEVAIKNIYKQAEYYYASLIKRSSKE